MNGAFKGLKQSDVYLTSYISKKQWQVASGSFGNLGISKTEATSGSSAYAVLKAGYYEGAVPDEGSFSGSYDLNLQSTVTLQGSRRLPSSSILMYTIPGDCFGENIEEGSLTISGSNFRLFDREGLVLKETGGKLQVVGDIVYNQGLILLDKSKVNPTNETLSWTSKVTINTWNIRCNVKDLECNYSYNPSIKDGNADIMGTSEFTPYISAVGLYNRAGELMAVAKLSKPIKKNDNIDLTFRVSIDV